MTEPTTPMMQQYLRIKAAHQNAILMFRLGDFYEMFYDDAKTAAKILGLTLTSRQKGDKAVPMAGVPYHAVESYVQRLIRAGYKVAICDQIQDPEEAKGIVDRDVTRVLTAGTLTEEGMLPAKSHNYLAAVLVDDGAAGLSWVDLSTGAFYVEDVSPSQILDELARIQPSECLIPEEASGSDQAAIKHARDNFEGMLTARPDWTFGRDTAMRTLLEHFKVGSLDGFGCGDLGVSLCAAGAIVNYLQETQKTSLGHINKLTRFVREQCVVLDRATQRSLELTQTMHTGEKEGSLLWVLDQTCTSMGGRLLREWVTSPLKDAQAIRARQEAVQELFADTTLREELRGILNSVYDLERLAAKVSTGRANARDLLSVKQSLSMMPDLKEKVKDCKSPMLSSLAQQLDPVEEVRVLIGAAIANDPPPTLRDGGLIREGYDQDLDEVRSIRRDGKSWIANFQASEVQRTGIPSLKVGYNKVFGYYIEITNVHAEKIPSDYIRKQTLKNAERYITPELKEYETRVLTADERSKELEYKIFLEVRSAVAAQTARLQRTAQVIAQVDVISSLASVAASNNYTKPEVCDDLTLLIRDGRHPVLERTIVAEPFVPNDIEMDGQSVNVLVITGPNMAGKSTYIRQVALLVLMAQVGSFIPTKSARIGIVDRIFTRVGASDELARGQSTFMVEMCETANILNNATQRSLLILDEVGRGTSTFDGVSIAWAVTEYICQHIQCRTLFATHYHELTELALMFPTVRNYNIAVKEWNEEIVFLRKIVDGGTDKSYGIHVARLAGIPREVVDRARVILTNLEANSLDINDKPKFAQPPPMAGQPLAGAPRRVRKPTPGQLSLFSPPAASAEPPEHKAVVDEVKKLDTSKMTPLDALSKLEELRKKVQDENEHGPDA
jgi:DNA mismatch repair protein MutS